MKKRAKHGLFYTPAWRSWTAMRNRMLNPKFSLYSHYGGRGLDMDPRWLEFEAFHKDMGDRPERMTLGRIDNNRGYWPDNCRWETRAQQSVNRSDNVRLTINGETKTLIEWARLAGIHHTLLSFRVKSGWPEDRLLIAPDPLRGRLTAANVRYGFRCDHPETEENTVHLKNGSRTCKTCKLDNQRKRKAIKREARLFRHRENVNDFSDDEEYCFECNNLGTIPCECGGDLCICLNNGEMPCPYCERG